MENAKYTYRLLSRFVIEAQTPISVGKGEKSILSDAIVATDVNGLPYIPGTSIAGVLRHSMLKLEKEHDTKKIMGFQDGDSGMGSRLIVSEAKIMDSDGCVVDGLLTSASQDCLLSHFTQELPIRQHVRINGMGTADHTGKFDEQVVFSGTRFCFEMEMIADSTEIEEFNSVLGHFGKKGFRIGSGTRNGFGEIKIIKLQTKQLDLSKKEDLDLYLSKSSKLSVEWSGWTEEKTPECASDEWLEYKLCITPEDFFLFGSGFGDNDADMTPVKECKVIWKDGKGTISDKLILIPASSVKGALSHRTAFYWNKINGCFSENKNAKVGKDNPAVALLFGSEGENDSSIKLTKKKRGNLLFSDVIEKKPVVDKVLTHVAIDRFTGGALNGALFNEKTTFGKGQNFELCILADKNAINDSDETICASFEEALKDICKGMLPLGGGVNRGNGVFSGALYKDGVKIYPEKK